jgi:acetate kinase
MQSILTINGGSSSIKFAFFLNGDYYPKTTERIARISPYAVRVIRTDEELMIARSIRRMLGPGTINKKD